MLYIALEQDLRDRYPGSAWLVYGKQIHETTFTADDVVILSEWSMEDHSALLDVLYHIRNSGARVIYIGAEDSDTDEWKRQLVFLGVWDFLFVSDELNLRQVDKLIDDPRTAKDIESWLTNRRTSFMHPQVVDIFDGTDDVPDPLDTPLIEAAEGLSHAARSATDTTNVGQRWAQGPRRIVQWLHRKDHVTTAPRTATADQTRLVWPSPKPVHISIVGSPGAGKSFIAWNLAALCDLRDLATCIVEPQLEPICVWSDAKLTHVQTRIPAHGYRTFLLTQDFHQLDAIQHSDYVLVVTFPDPHRVHEAVNWIEEMAIRDRAMLIMNHHSLGMNATSDIPVPAIAIPHDIRQVGAIRMRRPLALSDSRFAERFTPLVEQIGDMYLGQSERGESHVALAGV